MMPPLFGDPTAAMNAGAPAGVNGLPGPQGMPGPPQAGPGAMTQPDPGIQALANQVYALQQELFALRREMSDMRGKRVNMDFTLQRDNDGQMVGMTAVEGLR